MEIELVQCHYITSQIPANRIDRGNTPIELKHHQDAVNEWIKGHENENCCVIDITDSLTCNADTVFIVTHIQYEITTDDEEYDDGGEDGGDLEHEQPTPQSQPKSRGTGSDRSWGKKPDGQKPARRQPISSPGGD